MMTATRKPTTPQKVANHAVVIFVRRGRSRPHGAKHPDERDDRGQEDLDRVHRICKIAPVIGGNGGKNRHDAKRDQLEIIPHVVRPFVLSVPLPRRVGLRAEDS